MADSERESRDQHAPEAASAHDRLERAAREYAERLAELDRAAHFSHVSEVSPEAVARRTQLNEIWQTSAGSAGSGLAGRLAAPVLAALRPALDRQAAFNSLAVQTLNDLSEELERLSAYARGSTAAAVRLFQQVEPNVDARDRANAALILEHSELLLDAFARKQESLARRIDALSAMRDQLAVLTEEARAVRSALVAVSVAPETAAAAIDASRAASYTAFEDRFRGSQALIAERLKPRVELLRGHGPVLDLGCGRGELLGLLRDAGVEARGVEANAHCVQLVREKGLSVTQTDLLTALRAEADGSLGAVVAIHVAEHLPPAVLTEALGEARRVVRPGGLLLLETPNPRSVTGLLEVFHRDLTHERALHPDTLQFLVAAAGFSEVRVEMGAGVEASSLLPSVPREGLPNETANTLDEIVARLNALLYGPLEYAVIATR